MLFPDGPLGHFWGWAAKLCCEIVAKLWLTRRAPGRIVRSSIREIVAKFMDLKSRLREFNKAVAYLVYLGLSLTFVQATGAKSQPAPLGTLFGVSNSSSGTFDFVSVDPKTGVQIYLGAIPGFAEPSGGISALDAAGHRYFIVLTDSSYNDVLFSIDTQTGTVIASPPLPA
jgi:hypothetical protein